MNVKGLVSELVVISVIACAASSSAPSVKPKAVANAKATANAKLAADTKEPAWMPVVNAKPLSGNVKRGLAWLAKTQDKSGGWCQGEESIYMGSAMDKVKDAPNVADTCIAALAIVRSGSTPKSGEYAKNVQSAIKFVCAQIEESDNKSLSVTKVNGTRVQLKLGQYIDTFMASLLLSEAKGQMPDKASEDRVNKALTKVMGKIEKNQKSNGTWSNDGWAPVLAQSVASKAMNRAVQNGYKVDESVRLKAEQYAQKQYDGKSGQFDMTGSPGVALYSASASLGAMTDSVNTNNQFETKAREKLSKASSEKDRKAAQADLDRFSKTRQDRDKASATVVAKLGDQQFMSGFGSNGGEEFLSHMNIGESLVVKGGADWKKWDKSMTENMNRIQNTDGTWTGHHCITGRTFCTAAALLVLTVDRAPVPVASKVKRR